MTTIKLEIPTNDPVTQFHMGEALRNIAKENGYTVQEVPQQRVTKIETIGDVSMTVITEPMLKATDDVITPVTSEAERFFTEEERHDSFEPELLSPHTTVVESNDIIDADGLPHDKRIHSKGATRLNDDTWRMKKKPSDQTDEQWAEFVESVKSELKTLMDIPVATGEDLDVLAEIPVITDEQRQALKPPTLDELAVADLEQSTAETMFASVTPIDTDTPAGMSQANAEVVAPVVTPPIVNSVTPPIVNRVTPPIVNRVTPPIVNSVTPPVVTPPVTVTPPTDSDVPNTFPLFMKWLTTNNKKLTSDMVNKVLNDNGVTAIPLLTSRVGLIPQIHAALVKLL